MRGVGRIEIGRLVGVAFFLKQTISQIAKVVDQKKNVYILFSKESEFKHLNSSRPQRVVASKRS